MMKKTFTEKFDVLEAEDVERLVAEKTGRDMEIGEMDIAVRFDFDTNCLKDEEGILENSISTTIYIQLDEEDFEPIFTVENNLLPFLPDEYLFAFDVEEFNSYIRYVTTDLD